MSFFIKCEVREYNDRADKAEDSKITEFFGITNNPKGILTALGEQVEEKYPELKKIKWASAKDLEKLEAKLTEQDKP